MKAFLTLLSTQVFLASILAISSHAATRTWNASVSGGVQNWFPGTYFSPTGLTDGDIILFPNSSVHLHSKYNAGDYDFARIEFDKAGYVIEAVNQHTRISSRRWQLDQTSQSVVLDCQLATLFADSVIEVKNAAAGFELDGGIYFNSDATITIQGAGNVTVTDLTDDGSDGVIVKNGTGTFSIVRDNELGNSTIQLNSGYMFCGGSVWSGNCPTLIATGGTLMGSGTVGTIENRGTIRPGQTPSSDTRGYRLTVNGHLTCPAGANSSVVLNGYDDESMDSLLVYGNGDFTGANLGFQLSSGFMLALGQSITLVQNQGASLKPFANVPEGSRFFFTGQPRVFYQITYRGGSNLNSMTLTRIPTDLPSVSAARIGNNLQLLFQGQPNTIHQVQFSTNLTSWSNDTQVTIGTDGTASLNRAISGAKGYYRATPVEP